MSNPFFDTDDFDFESEKHKFIKNLDFLKSMSAEEQTFYKKWVEVQQLTNYINKSGVSKARIWTPTDINNQELTIKEIEQLKPTVVHVVDDPIDADWIMLRTFCHTMEYAQTPGRFIKLLISAIGSCIMSTQPFGYNFLGGKLVAALVTSNATRKIWKDLYGQTLVGITTTSLYGSYSMYNSLKWWHKCGSSTGKMTIKPDDSVYNTWHQWIKDNKADEYKKAMTQKEGVNGPVTGAKNRVLSMIFQSLNIKTSNYTHGYERGVYYSCFYENSKEFFQNKIGEEQLKMKELFKRDSDAIMEWWRPKAIERYKKLKSEGNLKPDILYYNKMIGMTYEEAKTNFFSEVGR